MVSKNHTEVIVIGAGPAGLGAAGILAAHNIKTTIFEKSKNYAGCGASLVSQEVIEEIYGRVLFPFERVLCENRFYFLSKESFTSVVNRSKLNNSCISRKNVFCDSLVKVLKGKGVSVNYETLVTDLIIQEGKVCGVQTTSGEFYSDVVVIGEGVKSVLAKYSGLRVGELKSEEIFLFVEEEVLLPSKVINERFNMTDDKGIAATFFTHELLNMPSLAYIYTNKDSLTLGTGVLLSALISSGKNINDCQEKVKSHSAVFPLIANGSIGSYSSYVMPAVIGGNGINYKRTYTDGCLTIGGAAMLTDVFCYYPTVLAILSGKIAGETIIRAKNANDYSSKTLYYYGAQIKEHFDPRALHLASLRMEGNFESFDLNMFVEHESLALTGK